MSRKSKAILPVALAIAMILGIVLGRGLRQPESSMKSSDWEKIDQILHYVESDYVDEVSRTELEEDAIVYLLQRLDPHSHYISQDELAAVNEPLQGSFQGIGVQFNLNGDTVYIINTIDGGPSEKAGIKAGDKLIAVEDQIIAGVGITNTDVMKLLKGESGTQVHVSLLRNREKLEKTITRGEVALPSIDAAYTMDDTIIYIKLNRFSQNTFNEFKDRVYPLKTGASKHFILDLRGNGGGLLDVASDIADEFLEDGKLITYTEGKSRPRTEFYATSQGEFEAVNLYLIINGYSASASEIIAGAMQDHKRATIYGKQSFGKGLVQEQNEWADGSATRLTVARYYTPNGRSIQREYESISNLGSIDSLTGDPRGGIRPDVEVLRDTAGITWLFAEMVHRGLISNFVYEFRDKHSDSLQQIGLAGFNTLAMDSTLIEQFGLYAAEQKLEIDSTEWRRSQGLIVHRLKALMVRNVFSEQDYIKVQNQMDPAIRAILNDIKTPTAL
ncbi:MAG: S41 family peptidase [Salibacteraceae bacterium]